MVNLFIANLDWDITSEDLQATFSAFGPVTYAHVVFDNATKKSKGSLMKLIAKLTYYRFYCRIFDIRPSAS
jgi:hypothetical protein